jgi:hypothetical protein
MLKPLREEQADMKARWSDPAYRWANDSNLRRKLCGTKKAERNGDQGAPVQEVLEQSAPR